MGGISCIFPCIIVYNTVSNPNSVIETIHWNRNALFASNLDTPSHHLFDATISFQKLRNTKTTIRDGFYTLTTLFAELMKSRCDEDYGMNTCQSVVRSL